MKTPDYTSIREAVENEYGEAKDARRQQLADALAPAIELAKELNDTSLVKLLEAWNTAAKIGHDDALALVAETIIENRITLRSRGCETAATLATMIPLDHFMETGEIDPLAHNLTRIMAAVVMDAKRQRAEYLQRQQGRKG